MNQNTPRVAVVVPCYNDGRFIPEVLASLAPQEAHELVIVDDGSSESETIEALRDVEADGVRVVRQENAGLAAARNAGVAATRARFVFPLDADDRLAPGALTAMADALDSDPGAQMAWGDWHVFGEVTAFAPRAPRLDPWFITYYNDLPAGTMVRRSALEAVGGWFADLDAYEDWDLWLSLAARGDYGVHVGRVTLEYRTHAQPRLWATAMRRHSERIGGLRTRHAELFDRRREHRRRSPLPRPLKATISGIGMVPGLSDAKRSRLYDLAQRTFVAEMRWCPDGGRAGNPLLEAAGRRARVLLARASR